jgi:hypothetical protein
MTLYRIVGGAVLLIGFAGGPLDAASARMLKSEPPMGKLRQGQRVLVDDGTCGPGKVKEVIGGNHWKVGGHPGSTIERTRRCIAR